MNIIISPIPQDLRIRLAEQVAACHDKDEALILLVPEQFTLQSEIWLLDVLEQEATIDRLVQSFSGLARTLLGRLGLPLAVDLNEASQRILLEKILIDSQQSRPRAGEQERLLETIQEFRREGCRPADLRVAAADFASSPITQDKLLRSADVLEAYEAALQAGFMDEESRLESLARFIPEADWLEDTHIVLSDFQDLSNLEIEVLAALDKKARSLSLYLLANDDSDMQHVFASSRRLMERLSTRLPLQKQTLPRAFPVASDLLQLAQQAMSYGSVASVDKGERIHLLRAMSVDQEVTAIAALIRRVVMEKGLRYRDFSLSVSNPEVYLSAINRIFRQNDIPVFIDARRELVDHPIVRMLLQLLRILEHDLPLDAVVALLQSGLVPVEAEKVMAFERQAMVHRVRWQALMDPASFYVGAAQGKMSQKQRLKEEERAIQAAEIAALLQELVCDLYRRSRRSASVREHATSLLEFFEQELLQEGLQAFQAAALARPEDGLAEENPQVLQALVDLLDELVGLFDDKRMAFRDFAALLRAGLEGISIGIIPPAQDQVQVGTLVRQRSEPKAVHMLMGLSDIWMPSQVGERTIFSEQEKTELAQHGIAFASRQDRLSDQEAISFYANVLLPEKMLVLSYPLSERNIGAMHPAALIERTKHLFPDLDEILLADILPELALYTPPTARRQAMAHLREGPPLDEEDRGPWQNALGIYRFYQEQDLVSGRFLKAGLTYRKQRRALAPSLAGGLYPPGRHGRVSISEIESMRACPYQHFVRYGLQPEEELTFDLEARDFGSILHSALDRLTADILKYGAPLGEDEEALYFRMDAYVQAAAADKLHPKRLADRRNQGILAKIRRDARKAGRHILLQLEDMDFKPIARELAFGDGPQNDLPAFVLELAQGPVRLEGRIDRLDGWHSEDGFFLVVIDYKTGSYDFDLTKAYDGLDAQLLLYLQAALAGDPRSKPAGLFYFSLRAPFADLDNAEKEEVIASFTKKMRLDGVFVDDPAVQAALGRAEKRNDQTVLILRQNDGNVLSERILKAFLTHAQKRAEAAVAEALEGDIRVRPAQISTANSSWSACQYCDYASLCHIERGDPFARECLRQSWKDLPVSLEEEGLL